MRQLDSPERNINDISTPECIDFIARHFDVTEQEVQRSFQAQQLKRLETAHWDYEIWEEGQVALSYYEDGHKNRKWFIVSSVKTNILNPTTKMMMETRTLGIRRNYKKPNPELNVHYAIGSNATGHKIGSAQMKKHR